MGLSAGETTKSAVQKRPKPAPQKRLLGVNREVAALYGERPPPVAVYEEKKTYRAKRQSTGPAKKWIQQPFTNPARSDGLILKHWRRKPLPRAVLDGSGEDMPMEDIENQNPQMETEYEFAKYNVQVEVPTYTDEEYETHLRSGDWSREETDYLLEMAREFYYRWPLIYDRYDFQPSTKLESQSSVAATTSCTADGSVTRSNETPSTSQPTEESSTALSTLPFFPPKSRTVEDLKARFYTISATLMSLRTPIPTMTPSEFTLHDMLTRYDPQLETSRKRLAAALLARNVDEVKEEEFLLAELQRINMSALKLDAERAELRERLESPLPNAALAGGLAQFQSSQALSALFAQLFQQDRSKKRASGSGGARLSLSATDIIGTPSAHHAAQQQAQQHLAGGRKAPLATPGGAGAGAGGAASQPVRALPPQLEYRFGISSHERLTSGVSFGSDKLVKMRQAKSNVQTQKIAAALAELGFSDIIAIPTARVGAVFEGLVAKVGKLLDVRKVREKEEGEVRVLEAMRAREKGEEGGEEGVEEAAKEAGVKVEATEDGNEEGGEDGEDGEDGEGDADADADEDADEDGDGDGDGDEDAEGEEADSERQESEAVSTRTGATPSASIAVSVGHKRSASVLSVASSKSTKRARK